MARAKQMISIRQGRAAVRRAAWFCAFGCGIVSIALLVGLGELFHLPAAIALYERMGWEPTPSFLIMELLMFGGSLLLFFALRWFLKVAPEDVSEDGPTA